MPRRETLCFDCKNAINGCCWAKKFEPVPGWVAQEKKIKLHYYSPTGEHILKYINTYKVLDCPMFICDGIRPIELVCKELNIYSRTYFRWRNNGLLEEKLRGSKYYGR